VARDGEFIGLRPASADSIPIAKGDHNLRRDQNSNACAHKQCRAANDIMQVAWGSVPISLSGPSSYNESRRSDAEKNRCHIY
jgi:hypothetical protein